jgi:hypothetical protein
MKICAYFIIMLCLCISGISCKGKTEAGNDTDSKPPAISAKQTTDQNQQVDEKKSADSTDPGIPEGKDADDEKKSGTPVKEIVQSNLKESEAVKESGEEKEPIGDKNMADNEFKYVTQAVIGPWGGKIEAGKSGSPIDGASVEIPAGAVEIEDTFSLGYKLEDIKLRSGKASGIVLILSAKKTDHFKHPVTISVKLDSLKAVDLVIPYEIDKKSRLSVLDIASIDKENHILSFYTFTPLTCTWTFPEGD